ncbi:hypothetical protein [Oceanicoccus sp. KOV_DT_Chl]|uniref:hypothetical protein n=1 Tax=Oceanicoccus sp. KOV_DT_Chl TaxID=1904639 RepID=UPI001F316F66|nr:hypothetical protein [Oceanicoccus sp. KOV_DT_Chl]
MDHTSGYGAYGIMPGYLDKYTIGNRPNGTYTPRFRNLTDNNSEVILLEVMAIKAALCAWTGKACPPQIKGFGKRFKQAMRGPGPWVAYLAGFGEHLPNADSRMMLDEPKKFWYSTGTI